MRPLPAVEVALEDALGMVLIRPVAAAHDLPPFANSAMDGYAVRSADVAVAPVRLRVVDDVPAGSVPRCPVGPGEATKIMTGAPMPEGADAVVRVEDTTADGDGVSIVVGVSAGANVRPAGGDVAAGTEVVAGGRRLTPPDVGVLASVGVARARVRRRPHVALMSTGDELMPVATVDLVPGAIRDSNRPLLRALLAEAGATVLDLGIVRDDAGALRDALAKGAAECDAVVTSGGVSMGEHDLVKQVLGELGGVDFWKVAMQPAKPFAFGAVGGAPFFGLPGNPVSVAVAFEQFLRPSLLTMMGADRVLRPRITGVMEEAVSTDPEKTVFLRAAVRHDRGAWRVRLSGGQGSNVLSALAAADGFAVVPRGTAGVEAGETVTLEMFRWPEERTMDEVPDE
jgi:molybdopterin molybdotransferase